MIKHVTICIITLAICSINVCVGQEKRAIVVGASSGMGREIARCLSNQGYTVGLVARRLPLLESLQQELSGDSYCACIDVTSDQARDQLAQLIERMGGLDLLVLSISAYCDNYLGMQAKGLSTKEWPEKQQTLNVDAVGFIALADVALEFFKKQNHGHLVGISSTSGQRGVAYSPEYSAAKACISYYLEAQRNYLYQHNKDVSITDVVAGYVAVEHSPLGTDPAAYWEITASQAARLIVEGIHQRKKIVYVPKRVWLIACLLKYLPDYVYNNYLSWI